VRFGSDAVSSLARTLLETSHRRFPPRIGDRGMWLVQGVLSVPLDHSSASPAVARARAEDYVSGWASKELCADLRLMVSELVTNAVLHGEPDVLLRVLVSANADIRVEVYDGSAVPPALRIGRHESTSGRGLQLIDAFSTAWGTRPVAEGKVVWFEVDGDTPTRHRALA
jgi:hypothetical protein